MTTPFETVPALAALPGIRHGFFGRRGGVSTGQYASLNVAETGGDDLASVAENRARAAAALEFSATALATLTQTHSNRVVTLNAEPIGRARLEADALVANHTGMLLGVLTADCTPILLADPEARVIAAAHAGWKGAVDGIVGNVVAAMVGLGALPDRIIAAIGPTISAQNYEVGPDFAAALLAQHPAAAARLARPASGREHFDLPGFVQDQLRLAGVGKIETLDACTYACPERYFSHRYATHNGTTIGRQISLIGLC